MLEGPHTRMCEVLAGRPVLVYVMLLLAALLLAVGNVNLRLESDIRRSFAPENSLSFQ